MDEKGRTFAFVGTKKPNKWTVLVFEQGKQGAQRFHSINVIGDVHGKHKAYCNCKRYFYSKEGHCHHVDAFNDYMEEQIALGKATDGKGNKIKIDR